MGNSGGKFMNQVQKLSSFIITIALAIAIFIWLALPYPWTPFGQWLESLVRDTNYCTCFWPWWLFVAGSIAITLTSSFIFRYLQLHKVWLWTTASVLNISIILYHSFARGYFLNLTTCQDSIYSPWVWLIILILTFIIVLLSKYPSNHR